MGIHLEIHQLMVLIDHLFHSATVVHASASLRIPSPSMSLFALPLSSTVPITNIDDVFDRTITSIWISDYCRQCPVVSYVLFLYTIGCSIVLKNSYSNKEQMGIVATNTKMRNFIPIIIASVLIPLLSIHFL